MNRIKPVLAQSFDIESNHEPLYKRLPTHDENGQFLSDFMLLIPGLKHRTGQHLKTCLETIHAVLAGHDDVVFADLNAPLNLLWVSVKSRQGVISELVAEIRLHIPEVRLVGHPSFANMRGDTDRKAIKGNG